MAMVMMMMMICVSLTTSFVNPDMCSKHIVFYRIVIKLVVSLSQHTLQIKIMIEKENELHSIFVIIDRLSVP